MSIRTTLRSFKSEKMFEILNSQNEKYLKEIIEILNKRNRKSTNPNIEEEKEILTKIFSGKFTSNMDLQENYAHVDVIDLISQHNQKHIYFDFDGWRGGTQFKYFGELRKKVQEKIKPIVTYILERPIIGNSFDEFGYGFLLNNEIKKLLKDYKNHPEIYKHHSGIGENFIEILKEINDNDLDLWSIHG